MICFLVFIPLAGWLGSKWRRIIFVNMGKIMFINALPGDDDLLTQTAMSSKSIWGYSDQLMAIWRPDLTLSREYILANEVVKVYDDDVFVGFFSLVKTGDKSLEIDHLWLVPGRTKQGYGQRIFERIRAFARKNGYTTATLIADPNAIGFYKKMGGRVIGKHQGKVKDRVLDIIAFDM